MTVPTAIDNDRVVLPAARLRVSDAWLFTFPTALGGTLSPRVRELWLEGREIEYAPVTVRLEGSAESQLRNFGRSESRWRHRTRRLKQKFTAMQTLALHRPFLDARNETDANLAHVLYDVLPRLQAVRVAGVEPVLVLRARATAMTQEVCRLLGVETVRTDAVVRGTRCVATSADAGFYEARLPRLLGDAELVEPWPTDTPAKVFIARRGSRALVNHGEVESLLGQRGYFTRYFEDLPMIEQWATMRNAESVVAVHGAAVANLAFAKRRPRVVELFHPGYVVDCYRQLTAAVGGAWSAVTGRLRSEDLKLVEEKRLLRACQARPIEIDVDALSRALDVVHADA